MAIKSKKTINFDGDLREVDTYLPGDCVLTKEAEKTADLIDEVMRSEIKKINTDFLRIDDPIKKNSLLKWGWLSQRLSKLIQLLRDKGLEEKDIVDNIIWIPIGQYLCDELSSGTNTRRAGTHKDHYRKVYLLSEIKGLSWINSWAGWDAFADRGDAILQYPGIFSELEKKFSTIRVELGIKDYQFIAKKLVEHIPMSGKGRKSVSSLSADELSLVAQKVFRDYEEMR